MDMVPQIQPQNSFKAQGFDGCGWFFLFSRFWAFHGEI
ncbi:hypothetical protein LINPERHAP1_LOCUS38956 [Linum perenne]